jgi:hypothetical protein
MSNKTARLGTAINGEVFEGDFVALDGHYAGSMRCGFAISEGSIGSGVCKIQGFQVEEANGRRIFYPADCTRIINRGGFCFAKEASDRAS